MSEIEAMFKQYSEEKGFGPRLQYVPGVGFATYHLTGEECYIDEIYVVPEKRRTQEASKIADIIAETAKNSGAKYLTGSVCIKANGREKSMKALLAYGFIPCATKDDLVYFAKEITNG